MYRWDRLDYLKKIHEEAKRDQFFIGMKLIQQNIKLNLTNKNNFNGTYQVSIENISDESKTKIDEFNN